MMGLDFVTGERLIHRELLSELLGPMNALPGFAIEVFMNRQIISRKLSLAVVNWPGVSQSRKTEKMGYARGTWAEFRMVAELLRTATPFTLLSQSISLLFLRAECSARVDESFALEPPPGPPAGQGKLAQRAHARMKASIVSMWAARRAGK